MCNKVTLQKLGLVKEVAYLDLLIPGAHITILENTTCEIPLAAATCIVNRTALVR
jgi:hypothetical protein